MARPLTDLLRISWQSKTGQDEIADCLVNGVSSDSREIKPGMVFVAFAGLRVDGSKYIGQAVANGCVAVIVENGGEVDLNDTVPVLEVDDSRIALAEIAAALYDYPARQMVVIGITGTNGKTTTTYLLESIIKAAGGNPGVIGTINYRFNGREFPAPFTTPEPVLLQGLLRDMADGGVTHLIMEASSHALSQKRLAGLEFDVALFTNLSRDHLDYHGSMAAYFQAKRVLFEQLKKHGQGTGVVLVETGEDESWGRSLLAELAKQQGGNNDIKIISCGVKSHEDIRARKVKYEITGTTVLLDIMGEELSLKSELAGVFNLKNIIGAVGVARALNLDPDSISRGVQMVENVPGRLERITGDNAKKNNVSRCPEVFVDYAHTPDALENVLRTLKDLCGGRLFVVFGCGGDRDRGKRFLMGRVAGKLADLVIITADNSRSESTEFIMAEIERGVNDAGGFGKYLIMPDRGEAIAQAIKMAGSSDVVLIAGKGHEDYQINNDGKIFFDDRLEALQQLNNE